jgi:hypothetical protein
MKIFASATLSDNKPETILKTERMSSDEPSIATGIAPDAPRLLTIKSGRIRKTISVEKFVKKAYKTQYYNVAYSLGLLWSELSLEIEFFIY